MVLPKSHRSLQLFRVIIDEKVRPYIMEYVGVESIRYLPALDPHIGIIEALLKSLLPSYSLRL